MTLNVTKQLHEAVKSLFYAVLTDLRVFVFAADPGLTPERQRKASGSSGERPLWRATLLKDDSWLISALFAGICFLAASAYR